MLCHKVAVRASAAPDSASAAEKWSSLTPHLVHPEQLFSVDCLKEQVPKLGIFCEDTVNQVFASAPVMG